MKKATQFVALLVALLFAAQSALASTPCTESTNGNAACCQMTSGQMTSGMTGHQFGIDCHGAMATESVAAECTASGCHMATIRAVAAQVVRADKTRANRTFAIITPAELPLDSAAIRSNRTSPGASAPGPAKYLLFQVFRI
jgi:hypothetical protein